MKLEQKPNNVIKASDIILKKLNDLLKVVMYSIVMAHAGWWSGGSGIVGCM